MALALALRLAFGASTAAEAAEPKAPNLRVVESRAFGVVVGEPLEAVLEAFARDTGLVYEVAGPLGGQLLSGRFDDMPAGEALADLLRHFDYTAVWRSDGTIGRLKVTGLRAGYHNDGTAAISGPGPELNVEEAAELVAADDRDIRGFEDREIWPEETSLANLGHAELREAAEFMDLDALAGKVGMPVEQLYLEPSGEELEPAPDLNLIRNLLQQLENRAEQLTSQEP